MTTVRNISADPVAQGAVAELNKLRLDLLKMKLGTIFHATKSTNVTAADGAGTSAALYALVLDICNKFNAHAASACDATTGLGAHVAADSRNAPVTATAVASQGAAATRLLAVKTAVNAHMSNSGTHMTNDGTNAVTLSTNASQAGNDLLANEIKTVLNAHFNAGFNSDYLNLIDG